MPRYYRDESKDKLKIMSIATIVFIVALISGFYLFDYIRENRLQKEKNQYQICSFDYEKTCAAIVQDHYENTIEIKDYLYYGETLNLFQEHYDLLTKDGLIGRTLMLTNLCNGSQMVYLVDGKIDNQIPVESLDEGFYSVSVMYDLVQRRAYSTDVIYDDFYTVRRNGLGKKISIIADKTLLDNEEQTGLLDRNYLFIKVETVEVPEEVYDIVIDPGHNSKDTGRYVEFGGIANGLREAEETYKIAQAIKERLEEYGLKVLITRANETEVINTYGIDGRLDRAYNAHAKYYLDLQMGVASNPNIRGTQIVHSSYTTSRMAVVVLNHLLDQTMLISTGNTGKGKISGVVPSGVINGYDGRMVIRESGGRILKAGTFSEKATEENGSFAANQRYGLQTLTLQYIYITSPEDTALWIEHYREYGTVTADGLAVYLGILE